MLSFTKEQKIVKQAEGTEQPVRKMYHITYQKVFWLFVFGSLLGVPLEGFWTLAHFGHWETHVVSVWGPFCILYGIGLAVSYIGAVAFQNHGRIFQFFAFSLIGSAVELASGSLVAHWLHMYAWDYSKHFMNYKGYVSLAMSVMWGVLGIAFTFLVPFIERIFQRMQGKVWKGICIVLSVFLLFDFVVTGMSLARWRDRHENVPATTQIERSIDKSFPNDWMKHRFCEWKFLDEKPSLAGK